MIATAAPIMDERRIAMLVAENLRRSSKGDMDWLLQKDILEARKYTLARSRAMAKNRDFGETLMVVELGIIIQLGKLLSNEDPILKGLKSIVVVDGDGEACGVCLEEMKEGDETRAMECMHRFHPCCIAQWLKMKKTTCPLCRHQMQSINH